MSISSSAGDSIAPDDASCRILIVSPSLARALAFVDRVRKLSLSLNLESAGTSQLEPESTSQTPQSESEPEPNVPESQAALGASTRIPWTLSNRYYSAALYFYVHTITGLSPHVVREAPAVVFVWGRSEAYKHHITRLAGDMRGAESEVALAVRVSHLPTTHSASSPEAEDEQAEEGEDDEEDGDIDEFLSSHGFEFVDASSALPSDANEDDDGAFSQGIPSLPRVLDALGTIMWPSMVAVSSSSSSNSRGKGKRDFEWARNSTDDDLGGLLLQGSGSGSGSAGGSQAKEREMEALTRWLEDDSEDPWRAGAGVATSPTEVDAPGFHGFTGAEESGDEAWKQDGTEVGGKAGFDDDFTVFVSAPPGDRDDSFDAPWDQDEGGKGGLGASALYSSLGSAVDLADGADDAHWEGDDAGKGRKAEEEEEGSDDDLPTDAEIEAMSARIFGHPMGTLGAVAANPLGVDPPLPAHGADGISFPGNADAGGEFDLAPFDLSRVMSALEGMKAEIAGMPDEDARRRAAAKVALGLVYGLEADAKGDA
ncbi:hypothetical protein DFH07DRAFT_815481 [Mycena maculata]|uniref:Uncharacterized protein n=1 Tax=Mycena maculata TaxID=230809 RepID=A0AAD7NGQ0_9AGAR|nr:hypothetical protein DFH07DRAFT_815481 [Mycena maculata]